jgi:RraA family protein
MSPDPAVADLVERYRTFETADISDLCNRMYTMSGDVRDLSGQGRIVGSACTVKVFPGDNLMVHKALDVALPGQIVVVDTSGSDRNAVIGDMIANKARHRGIAGFVIDGRIRDLAGVREAGLPVFARGVTPVGPLHRGPGEVNYPISCGGIVVQPGDLVVADDDGVVVVRRDFAESIVEVLEAQAAGRREYAEAVRRGEFSNAWVDEALDRSGCLQEDA